jgi:hypothetical protein
MSSVGEFVCSMYMYIRGNMNEAIAFINLKCSRDNINETIEFIYSDVCQGQSKKS